MSYGDYANHVRGEMSELNFKVTVETLGWDWEKAPKSDDIFKHIDCTITKPHESKTVDVKGIKKKNGVFNPKNTYIEFVNTEGNPGWLFGDVEYFAFEVDERKGAFLVVERNKLIALVFGHAPSRSMDRIFQRPRLKDWVTTINTSLIAEIAERWERDDSRI
jgi:hypothetical protein